MKITWLDLNCSYSHSSLALPALHAQMPKDDTTEWNVVSATTSENAGTTATQVCQQAPDIVAATAWLFNHEQLLHICARVKSLMPQCLIVLGGPEFLGDNESYMRCNRFVSCVFRGEGEEVFAKWLKNQHHSDSWREIDGICYIDRDEQYIDNGIARVMEFDKLAPPEESCFFNWNKPFVQLETTRGCFNTCAFCVSGGEKPVRTLDIETIRQRLKLIHQHGIKDVRVLDRTFNYNNHRAKELLELFREFAPDMRFHLEMHPALLTEQLKQELKQMPMGLLHLEAGIQSLREPVLETSRRIGKLNDALEGLQFLCSLRNMETHADLIAGLPLYHLTEIYEDIATLAEYGAGEIQLELLKLLPGTEMRRRAQELGIIYSPLPPYEVLQTNEISMDELQTARQLSRLLDGFYNATAWQTVVRKLIVNERNFLHIMLQHLVQTGLIDQPLSLEKRGLILYDFCKKHYPNYLTEVSVAWIEAGMSLKKRPAERVRTKHQVPPVQWEVAYGKYQENLRLCFLPTDHEEEAGYWFGFETETQNIHPVFRAKGKNH